MGQTLSTELTSVFLSVIKAIELYYLQEEELRAHNLNHRLREGGNRHRDREYGIKTMEQLSEDDFLRMFRMSKAAFENLLILIDPYLPITNEKMAQISSGSTVNNRTKLACTLRWLAGGSYLDTCFEFGVSKATFYAADGVVWPVMEAIDVVLEIGLPVNDPVELQRISKEFDVYSHSKCFLMRYSMVMYTNFTSTHFL